MNPILQTKIEAQIKSDRIVIYMKGTPEAPQCGFSAATVQVFQALGKPFSTFDILQDPELRQGMKEFSQWPTFPQVYIDGEFVGGCDIIMELNQRGELAQMVA
jgi:monothiol glutaredoxin